MSQATRDLKAELRKSAAILRTLRDELRVQIHLGGMDAEDAWNKTETKLEAAVERASKEMSTGSHAALVEAHRKLAGVASPSTATGTRP